MNEIENRDQSRYRAVRVDRDACVRDETPSATVHVNKFRVITDMYTVDRGPCLYCGLLTRYCDTGLMRDGGLNGRQ